METFDGFDIFIGLILFVLFLILFIKIWRMTNNVRYIKEWLTEPKKPKLDPMFYVWAADGNIAKAKELFYPFLFETFEFKDFKANPYPEYTERALKTLKTKYAKEFALIGDDFDFEKFKENSDF